MESTVTEASCNCPWDARVSAEADVKLLTAREFEVFELLGSGLTNSEISARLFITSYTVKAHLGRICGKLGLRTRTAAALAAQRHLLRLCPFGQ